MNRFVKIGGFVLLGLVVLGAIVGEDDKTKGDTPSGNEVVLPAATLPEVLPVVALPEQEKQFVSIAQKAITDYSNASTDMQRGLVYATRNSELCSLLQYNYTVLDWIGSISLVTTNSEGLGVIEIEIADGISVGTWNNAISDIFHETLVPTSSSVFAIAAVLKAGDTVRFSGRFFQEDDGCIGEQSLTLRSKVKSPTFVFRFSDLIKM